MNVPDHVDLCKTEPKKMHGLFPVIDEVEFGRMHFEIWESLGGHIAGQLFLYEKNAGLLFTSDALINFAGMTKEEIDAELKRKRKTTSALLQPRCRVRA